MADMIKFQQGELSRLAAKPITKGTLWFTTDEGAIYLDTAKGERVRFGDYITVANVNALPSAGHAYETALYYAKEENILARWDKASSKWVQLNAAGLSEIDDGGSVGNVLSGVSVVTDAKGRKKLTFTKTTVATTDSVNALAGQVAELETNYKAADANLLGKTTDAAGAATIHGALKAAAAAQSKADANATAITTLDADLQGQIDGLSSTVGGHTTAIADLVAEDTKINKAITDMDTAYKAADAAVKKALIGADSATGDYKTVNALSAAVEAAEDRLDTAEGNISTNGTNITNLQTDVSKLQQAVGGTGTQTVQARIEAAVAALREEILTLGTDDDGIHDAYDTIQEIAAWLGENQLGKDAATIISDLNALSGTVGEHTESIAGLVAEDTAIRQAFAAADTTLKTGILGQANTNGIAYATIKALSEAVKANEGNISGHEGRLDSAESTISGHTQSIADLVAADTSIRQAFAAADTTLKTGLLGQADTTGIAYATIKALSAAVKANEGNISTNASDIDALEGTTGTHTEQIASLTSLLTWGEF